MATTLLQDTLEVTANEFVESVFEFNRVCERKSVRQIFLGLLKSGSTLLNNIAHTFHPDEWKARKEDQECLSRWLERYSLLKRVQTWMLKSGKAFVRKDTGIAVDLSDISKPWGGDGMEGMGLGRDGSTHELKMGHLFGAAAVVPNGTTEARPVFVKLQKGRRGEFNLFKEIISTVRTAMDGLGVFIMDRGCDSAEFLWWLLEEHVTGIVRMREMKRDLFGTGRKIDEDFTKVKGKKIQLARLSGHTISAQVKWQIGYIQQPVPPRKMERIQTKQVLIVESSFEGKSIYLFMTLSPEELKDSQELDRRAKQAAQLYLNRWEIELSFLHVKQNYGLETARVRTFQRLENLFALCYLCHLFMNFHLSTVREYRQIKKIVRDNVANIGVRATNFLQLIRDLLKVSKLRFISGRPRIRRPKNDGLIQLELPFFIT